MAEKKGIVGCNRRQNWTRRNSRIVQLYYLVILSLKAQIQLAYYLGIMPERNSDPGKIGRPSKECQLCGSSLPTSTDLRLCSECIKCADCCLGLEKIKD